MVADDKLRGGHSLELTESLELGARSSIISEAGPTMVGMGENFWRGSNVGNLFALAAEEKCTFSPWLTMMMQWKMKRIKKE